MNAIFDSASALQRFKNRNSLQISSPNHASSYILMCKIKKILNRDVTDEVWKRYLDEYFVDGSKVDMVQKINQFILRVEKLNASNMKVLLSRYDNHGIWELLTFLSMPMAKLIRLTSERKRDDKAEMY